MLTQIITSKNGNAYFRPAQKTGNDTIYGLLAKRNTETLKKNIKNKQEQYTFRKVPLE